jgi:FkbM family methyltransferase
MPAAKQVLRTVHDAVFRDRAYVARHGFEEGYRLVGRMPWFQRPLTDPAAIREHEYFAGLSLAGGVAYDIGANEGSHTLALRRRTGAAGRVYAFEPEPGCFARLARVVALNRLANVAVFAVALSDETGVGRLALPADGAAAELAATIDPDLRAMIGDDGTAAEIEVPMIRLDEWIREMELAPPDFMKIDVEGLEVAVLDGAADTIAAARPTLFVEIHGADAPGKTAHAAGVLDRLAPLGYRFRHLESGAQVTPETPERAAVGHLICEPA